MKSPIALFLIVLFLSSLKAQETFPAYPPDSVNYTMDRDQMMWQLGIKFPTLPPKKNDLNRPKNIFPSNKNNPEGNWTNSNGNIYTRSGFGLWNNYDEEEAGEYTPINLLKMNDGTIIKTADEWWTKRRPEIKHDVENEIWGVIPPDSILPSVTFAVKKSNGGYGFNAYIQKDITGTIDISRFPKVRNIPKITATLRIPAAATQPVPVMIIFGGFGNVLDRYWQITSAHGWGVCIFNPNDLQPDNGTGLTSYLIGLVNKGNWRTPEQWGTLAAWSWGISRLLDYFETDKDVDAQHIGLSGHSRYGKATLVAMAYEPRLAIAFPSCGGALGPSMIRRHWGQDLENISWEREYHWVAGNFFKYMGPLNEDSYMPRKVENLTVDAHSLLALCAPRPVFLNAGTQDTWTDYYGTYLTAKGASPVYELLGKKGIVMPDKLPEENMAYIAGDIGYRYHIGGHTDIPDWPTFFKFAAKYIKAPVLLPSSTYLSIAAGDSSAALLKVKSNMEWQAFRSEGWILPDKKSGTQDDSVLVRVKENPFSEGRSANLRLKAKGIVRNVSINQASADPTLSISNGDLTIAAKDTPSVSFDIKSNTAWGISSSETWLYPQEESGINNDTVILRADDNPGVEKRTATVTISAVELKSRTFKIIQKEGAPTLNINTKKINLDASEGSSAGLWASSNTTWTVESSAKWLIPDNTTGGNGFDRISFTASENNGPKREAKILVKVKGLPDYVIEVTQAGM